MSDTDNISAWIKDDAINTYGPLSCNFNMDKGRTTMDGTQKSTVNYGGGGGSSDSLGYGMDYAICGQVNDIHHEGCILLSKADFKNTVMDNCNGSDDSKIKQNNYDPCNNMATNTTHGPGIYKTTDDHTFNPRTCAWNDDPDDRDDDCETGYAMPVHTNKISDLMKASGSHWGTRDPTPRCPAGTGYPQGAQDFECALDGNDNDDILPACGHSREIDNSYNYQWDRNLRVCKRKKSDYDYNNVMDCCINDTTLDNWDDRSKCPAEYCVTKIDYTDAGDADSSCTPIIVDEPASQHCFQMSEKCQDIFEQHCTKDAFLMDLGSATGQQRAMNKNCKKWSKIFPQKFATLANEICDPRRLLEGTTFTTLKEYMSSGTTQRQLVIDIFKSGMCRNYIEENLSEYQSVLRDICSLAMQQDTSSSSGKWVAGPLYSQLLDVCPCYYPDEYYEWWKRAPEEEGGGGLFTEDGIESTLHDLKDAPCFFKPCMKTLLFDKDAVSGSCPNIEVCINKIESKITYVDDQFDSIRTPDIEAVQQCNFSTQTVSDTDEGVSVDGVNIGVDDGTAAQYSDISNNLISSDTTDMNDQMFGERESSDSSSSLVLLGVVFFCSVVVVFIILMTGKSSVPHQPMMPGFMPSQMPQMPPMPQMPQMNM
jgi:hypothetical protein